MANAGEPGLHQHGTPRHFHWNSHIAAVVAQCRADGQLVKIGILINGNLIAFAVDSLMKIALPVEQTHGDKRQTHIAGRFAVIAREYT